MCKSTYVFKKMLNQFSSVKCMHTLPLTSMEMYTFIKRAKLECTRVFKFSATNATHFILS